MTDNINRYQQLLESMGIHDKPRCEQPYEAFTRAAGLVTITCHKPGGHDEHHSGGIPDVIAATWGPDVTQTGEAIAYRQGLVDRS